MTKFVLLTTVVMVLLLCSNALVIDRVVVDLNGSPILSGQSYTIVIDPSTSVGVFQISDTCPLYIVQQALNLASELIFTLVLPLDLDQGGSIFEGTGISIQLASISNSNCSGSPVLQVVDDTVQTGGVLGVDLFKIIRSDNQVTGMDNPVYKLQSCLTDDDVESCLDIGISVDSITGKQLLAVVNSIDISPFFFQIMGM